MPVLMPDVPLQEQQVEKLAAVHLFEKNSLAAQCALPRPVSHFLNTTHFQLIVVEREVDSGNPCRCPSFGFDGLASSRQSRILHSCFTAAIVFVPTLRAPNQQHPPVALPLSSNVQVVKLLHVQSTPYHDIKNPAYGELSSALSPLKCRHLYIVSLACGVTFRSQTDIEQLIFVFAHTLPVLPTHLRHD